MKRVMKEEALAALESYRQQWGLAVGDCWMCALNGERASQQVIHESSAGRVVLDRFGSREGHLLVLPRQHIEDITQLGEDGYLGLQKLALRAAEVLKRELNPLRTWIAALGAPCHLPMSFPHFHLHVIPIFEADDRARPARVFSWTDGVVLYTEGEAAELSARLRAAWMADVRRRASSSPLSSWIQKLGRVAALTGLLGGSGCAPVPGEQSAGPAFGSGGLPSAGVPVPASGSGGMEPGGAGGSGATGGTGGTGASGPALGTGATAAGGGAAGAELAMLTALQPFQADAVDAGPLTVGLLEVSPDGVHAVALDPPGQRAFVVNLSDQTTQEVSIAETGTPRRVAVSDSTAYVLTSSGQVSSVRLGATGPTAALELGGSSVCRTPEGMALHQGGLWIACRDGTLAKLSGDPLALELAASLEPDLRDVVPFDDHVVVSRFLSAEMLVVSLEGALIRRLRPSNPSGARAEVAWRTVRGQGSQVVVAHQINQAEPLQSVYSGACGGVAAAAVSVLEAGTAQAPELTSATVSQQAMPSLSGTLDLASDGLDVHVVAPGKSLAQFYELDISDTANVSSFSLASQGACDSFGVGDLGTAVPVGVTLPRAGPYVGSPIVLTLAPAALRVTANGGGHLAIPLHDQPRVTEGLALFEMVAPGQVACASCHPQGRADGHVWEFSEVGPRRTQTLEGGVTNFGAFHWRGELETFGDFLADVLSERMDLRRVVGPDSRSALLSFLDEIPAPVPLLNQNPERVAQGQRLFDDDYIGCASCHGGPYKTDSQLHDVGTGSSFVTPSLLGIGYRGPFMHDGCAPDLKARFGVCGGGEKHGHTAQLTDSEIDALVAYMTSL